MGCEGGDMPLSINVNQADSLAACPHCGQRMLVRFGIAFQPLKADILDIITNTTKGQGGMSMDALCWTFYQGLNKQVAANRIKTHVNQINELLLETDYRIVSDNPKRLGAIYKFVEVPHG